MYWRNIHRGWTKNRCRLLCHHCCTKRKLKCRQQLKERKSFFFFLFIFHNIISKCFSAFATPSSSMCVVTSNNISQTLDKKYTNTKKPRKILLSSRLLFKRRRLPTLPHCIAVPSAQVGLTSLFGMGRGGTPPQ